MDIKKLMALRTTAELGSISRAADKLGYSQPGLTGLLNRLEEEVGCALLERSSSGVTLTAKGSALMPYIDRILAENQEFEKAVQKLLHEHEDVIRIGSYTSISRNWLPKIIRKYSGANPQLKLIIKDGAGGEIERWLSEGTIDLALFSSNFSTGFDFIPLLRDPYYAVLPPSSEPGDTYDIRCFESSNFLVPSNGADLDVLRLLQSYSVTPQFSHIATEDMAAIKMVEQGLGVSIMSELVLRGSTDNISLARLDPPAYRELGVGLKSLKQANPRVKEFIKCLRDFAGNLI